MVQLAQKLSGLVVGVWALRAQVALEMALLVQEQISRLVVRWRSVELLVSVPWDRRSR
ncbi:MAG: hypothetical protein HYX84_04460 [Chloroflexi bacterium]|nr:hypothetical protein [Chloroflexota bacterium]